MGIRLCLSRFTSRSMISTGSSIKCNLSSSWISSSGITKVFSSLHFLRFEHGKVLWNSMEFIRPNSLASDLANLQLRSANWRSTTFRHIQASNAQALMLA
ncbi:hypothetical protein Tco_1267898 [Tanacetum coccineum]